MKPKKMVKTLQFKKESIAKLNLDETGIIKGGYDSGLSGITCMLCDTRLSCSPAHCLLCASDETVCAEPPH